MRIVVAHCSVDYAGRLSAHLPLAPRVLMLKADGSILVHSDGGSYKPLNWMSPPAVLTASEPDQDQADAGITEIWTVTHRKTGDSLIVSVHEILSDTSHELGVDPGLVKDGVEAHLQVLLAEQIDRLGDGYELWRREYMTPIGPVDILARDSAGATVAVEIKRRAHRAGDGRVRGAGDQAAGAHARRGPRHTLRRARLRRHARHRLGAHAAVLGGGTYIGSDE